MNKKAELLTLTMVLISILVMTILIYESQTEVKKYMGDNSTKIVYNLESKNESCNFDKIKIERGDIRFFKTKDEAIIEGFRVRECP